jgi:hypothetical protein
MLGKLKDPGNLSPRTLSTAFLVLILVFLVLAVLLLNLPKAGNEAAHGFGLISLALMGIALGVACLFVFPKDPIWGASGDARFQNDVRNTLVSAVAGAFALSALFFTYNQSQLALQQTQLALEQTDISRRGQLNDQIAEVFNVITSGNPGAQLYGFYQLGELMKNPQVNQRLIYGALAGYIRTNSPWTAKKRAQKDGGYFSETTGLSSLRKRTPDV